ncbi:MAG TPA: hypothetical protein H9745_08155 [Candidatus Agathobaculum stercoravium]|nr:hypothetical protein [Candidatus Agathobaculum stercoravium]
MYSSYPYAYSYATYSMPSFYSVFLTVLAALVIVAGGLALYFLFVRKPNHYQGAVARLHDALSFRTFYTEKLLRALYCIAVVSIVVSSVILLFSNFFGALLVFIAGNLIARIVFEFALLLLVLCRNTQEINQKMGPLPGEPAAPQPPQDTVPPSQPQAPQPGAVPSQPPQSHTAPQNNVPPQAPIPPRQEPPQPPKQ